MNIDELIDSLVEEKLAPKEEAKRFLYPKEYRAICKAVRAACQEQWPETPPLFDVLCLLGEDSIKQALDASAGLQGLDALLAELSKVYGWNADTLAHAQEMFGPASQLRGPIRLSQSYRVEAMNKLQHHFPHPKKRINETKLSIRVLKRGLHHLLAQNATTKPIIIVYNRFANTTQ